MIKKIASKRLFVDFNFWKIDLKNIKWRYRISILIAYLILFMPR